MNTKTTNVLKNIGIENEDQLYEFLQKINQLQEVAADIATEMVKVKGGKRSVDAENIYFLSNDIYVDYDVYMGCGEWETDDFRIPNEYFFDNGFVKKAKEAHNKEQEEKKRKARELAERRKKEAEERERKKYLELKAKFENEMC